MSEGRLFGTDGVRGPAGEPPLDPPTVRRIGRALAESLGGRVLIGRDTRESGVWIEQALCEALEASGCATARAGVIPTPGVAYITRQGAYSGGIVISASHNPYQDNGIKVFAKTGEKLSDDEQRRIEARVGAQTPSDDPSDPKGCEARPLLASDEELRGRYVSFLRRAVGQTGSPLEGLKVVLDCAHGAAYRAAPEVFASLGAEAVVVNADPDGRNINRNCGAMHPQGMARHVKEAGADLGASFDGDADRVALCDEEGSLLDGDHLLLFFARRLLARGALKTRAVVATVMSNMGLEKALGEMGVGLVRSKVGDRWVWDEMKRGGHELGGEESGHIIQRQWLPSGDGLLAAVHAASIVASGEARLSDVRRQLVKYPQVKVNVPVSSKPDFAEIPAIQEEIKKVEERLDGRGRLLVRYSGTEPKVRIMVEGKPGLDLRPLAQGLARRFREELGASDAWAEGPGDER